MPILEPNQVPGTLGSAGRLFPTVSSNSSNSKVWLEIYTSWAASHFEAVPWHGWSRAPEL